MKRFFFFLFLLTASVAVNAQTQEAPKATAEERAHQQTMRLQKILTLTAEQTTQIEQVVLTRVKAVDAIKADQTKTKEVKKAEVAAATATQDKEFEKILTKEQYAKYLEHKKNKEEGRRAAASSGQ